MSPAACFDPNPQGFLLRRTERENESGGLPDLPNAGRLVELAYEA